MDTDMPIKFYNPTSPGRRGGSVIDYKAVLTKSTPEKSLTVGQRRANGRNHHGVITAKHTGGGNKRLYRLIDFKRRKDGIPANVEAIEYDPNRSCFIALIKYEDGEKAYILAPNGLKVGAKVMHRIDHRLGGGEGRSNGGRPPVSKPGVPAKGGITRSPRARSEKLILRRRKFGPFQQRPQTVNV